MKKNIVSDTFGVPSINGIVCTYKLKKIRTEIEEMFSKEKTFNLPDKYDYIIISSNSFGKVAKIINKSC